MFTPVLFGPRHANAREAGELIERRGAVAVKNGAELERTLERWIDDSVARRAAGEAASNYIQTNLGAGKRNAYLITKLLPE